ncbi:hypothetical protein FEF65_05150 [Mariprofundus erugo]|uniref:Uncharacterized protein n=1 Tax=Mariprofundus erugo TaxID=2528639 RepID=A0A5R9GUA2_9PROT|nr:hypothetical protein [Mariprofundus erugo]TLS67837.1 hypothetical protein FEF65_05150 [Mariprofundus erugo]
MTKQHHDQPPEMSSVEHQWGEQPDDHFGYASEDERRAKRGLEDWEMVEQMSEHESNLSAWLRTAVGATMVGIVVFIMLAYGVYYFLMHFGSHFFNR